MYCTNCGKEVQNDRFCVHCGEPTNIDLINNTKKCSPISAYADMFRKYFDFNGRCGRREFWYAVAVYFVVAVFIEVIVLIITELMILAYIYSIICFIPMLALHVRRLHDIGVDGIRVLWGYIPIVNIVGSLYLLYLCCIDGQPGVNQYGVNPKEIY